MIPVATERGNRQIGAPRQRTPSSTPAVWTRGLGKSFGQTQAVRDLDLEIERGTVFGFLGPNGAGKTTTIRLLLDLIRPSSGEAKIFGHDVNRDGMVARRLCSYLPGELKLPERPTAEQFLRHVARVRGDVEWGEAERLAVRLGLELGRCIGDLSKGNRQKVGLVASFMPDPALLVLDEPTSGLDPIRQLDVQKLIRERTEAGRTVFLSSHALDQVEHVADDVGIIRDGALVDLESVADLRRRAMREVVVRFKGEPPRLDDVPGIGQVEFGDGVVRMHATGSMDGLVKAIARTHVESVTSGPPELDEIFLAYYGGDDGR